MRRLAFVLASLVLAPACVPADESLPVGSVQFMLKGSKQSIDDDGVPVYQAQTIGGRSSGSWTVRFDRVVLGFRTMTIGKVGDDDRCAFRGRGETSDVVFDPRKTLLQTFNGIAPANCEDTGIFLSPPGDATQLGPGATAQDLFDLATGIPAHAIIDATATKGDDVFKVSLRFDSVRTSSRFGGCAGRFEAKGVRVRANERTLASATFAPENMFQDSLGFGGGLRFEAFLQADFRANDDGHFTMDDADAMPLREARSFGEGYQLPNGTSVGSFGDYLRALFRFTFFFKELGTCVGNEPGAENE